MNTVAFTWLPILLDSFLINCDILASVTVVGLDMVSVANSCITIIIIDSITYYDLTQHAGSEHCHPLLDWKTWCIVCQFITR